ncbi:MAG: sugar kinase [Halieaceae bacterium]|nr:sugar kinase [Halieaceae bacterium]
MKVCCAGEVMLEIAAADQPGLYRRGFAGDSFNTAVYLARAGYEVDYLTRIGDDAISRDILRQLHREQIGTELVVCMENRLPGLYMIENSADGERRFTYWRDHSPARELFDLPVSLDKTGVFYFTGITLAVTRSGIEQLCSLLESLRGEGCRIVFDPNYREQLWDDRAQARSFHEQVLPYCDMVMPTMEDEQVLWGVATVDDCLSMYRNHGAAEIVIKGSDLVGHASSGDQTISLQAGRVQAVDTSGAGDSFNAGYLACRLAGGSMRDSLMAAQTLSARVVQHRGAILPRQ